MEKRRRRQLVVTVASLVLALLLLAWWRCPPIVGKLTKQTIFLATLDCFHLRDSRAEPCFLLIDDDSGRGVMEVKDICDRVGLKCVFAVVPGMMDDDVCDSLRKWQQAGFGIAFHGLSHDDWKHWPQARIEADIEQSRTWLADRGFARTDRIGLVATPYSCNSWAIRRAVAAKKMKMVVSANVVNPDTTVFQYGRFFITRDTDLEQVRQTLRRAQAGRGFVVIGTHSSIEKEFSPQKTEAVLRMALDMGLRSVTNFN